MAPQVIDSNNNYEQECAKLDQMRPIFTSTSNTYPMSLPQSDKLVDFNQKSIPTISVSVHSAMKATH